MQSRLLALFAPFVAIWPAVAQDTTPHFKVADACSALNRKILDLVANGRLAESDAALSEALLGREEGDQKPSCLWLILHNRAAIIALSGRLAEAEVLTEQSLSIMDGLFSTGDPARLPPLYVLWSVQSQQEKWGRARQTFRKMQLLRLDSPRDQATFYGAAAAQLQVEGKIREAETQFLKAIDAWNRLGSGETCYVATLLTDLGKLQLLEGRYAEAGQSLHRALTIVQSARDAVPMDWINVFFMQAALYARQGKWQAAAEKQGAALALADRDARLDPPRRKLMMANFAYILRKARRAKEAKSIEALAAAIQGSASTMGLVDVTELVDHAKTRRK